MNFFALSGIFVAVAGIGLGMFVLQRMWHSYIHRIWGLFDIYVGLWGAGVAGIGIIEQTDPDLAMFTWRITHFAVIFIPITFLHFTLLLLKKKWTPFVLSLYGIGGIFTIINTLDLLGITNLFIVNVRWTFNSFFYDSPPGIAYYFFAAFFVICVIIGHVLLLKQLLNSKGLYHLQLKYFFYSLVIAFGGGSTAFLPVFGIDLYPALTAMIVIYPGAMTYAIIRHRLMDIRLVITRSLIFFFLTLSVTAAFVLVSSLTAMFFSGTVGANKYTMWFITAFIIVLAIDPLKNGLAQMTDKFLFKGKINYTDILQHLTELLSKELDTKNIVKQTEIILKKDLKIDYSKLLLSLGGSYFLDPEPSTGSEPNKNNYPALIEYINEYKTIIVTDELERKISDFAGNQGTENLKKVYNEIKDIKAAVVAPVFRNDKISALMLLGNKTSGDIFTDDDIKMLEMIAPQLSSALFKASLFQEAQLFNVKLQKEVDKATKDLQQANVQLKDVNLSIAERNKNLTSLQKFSNTILSSLDTEEVAQKIIDMIPLEIKHCSNALLALVDEKNKNLIGTTIPQTVPAAQHIFKLIGKDLYKYKISLKNTNNSLLAKAVIEKKYQTSDKLVDFLSPPLPEEVCKQIQNIDPPMKSGIVFPLIVGNKVLGVLFYSLGKKSKDVNQTELRMLEAVTDEMGLALERAQVYARIKKVNDQLKDANEHLKNLDKAKSEFMSIASHQLRTPLSGIMGYLSMILDGDYGKLSKEQLPIIKEVFEASERLIRLVNLFLNVTRIEAGRLKFNWTEVDIKKVLAELVHELKPTADKKGLKLSFKEPKIKFADITVDSDKIQDIILNLIDNAIKYSQKGKIEVLLKKPDKDHIEILVKDNGMGIDPKDADNLFNKFIRGDGMVQVNPDGAGLGLFIAKKITEGHNGDIWAESKGVGKGSTFHVLLPFNQPKGKE